MVVVREDKLPRKLGAKADSFDALEGIRPDSDMASDQVTTGVLDQSMNSWG